jgi:HK97 family phage major capsid protein
VEEKDVKKLSDEFQVGVNAIREKLELLEKKNIDKDVKDKEVNETIEKVQKSLDKFEVDLKDHKTHSGKAVKDTTPEHKAFMDYLRYGQRSEFLQKASPLESKVMKISDDTTGGYLATPEITNDLLKTITEYSPIRTIATVRTTGKEEVQIRTRTGVFSANWVGEVDTKTETTGWTFGLERVPVHELYAMVDITNWDLEDSDFNLESELSQEFGERFGVAEGTAFVTGNTTIRPEGFLVNANVANANSGDANNVTADGLITLYFAPKTGYVRNGTFVMARATMAYCSKLKDNDAQYLLRRLGESPVWTILGAPVVECVDMPPMSNNNCMVAFGDFRRAYTIVDRIGISVLRDPYSAATTNSVRFHARKRVGGKVVQAEAIYKMLGKA